MNGNERMIAPCCLRFGLACQFVLLVNRSVRAAGADGFSGICFCKSHETGRRKRDAWCEPKEGPELIESTGAEHEEDKVPAMHYCSLRLRSLHAIPAAGWANRIAVQISCPFARRIS
jgi:hypothetical protein